MTAAATMGPADPAHASDGLVTFEGRALGSALRLAVLPADDDPDVTASAAGAWAAVVTELDAVDRALSRFRADSELTALNRLAGSGRVVRVSRRLRAMLAVADRANRVTGGRFDARVLAALERIGERGASLADPAPGGPVGAPAGGEGRPVRAPAVPVDSGGIGKGLAIRWAAAAAGAALRPGSGLLLDAGGDIVAAGRAPEGGWLVGIEDPAAEPGPDAQPVAVVALRAGAVATSSVRVRNWVAPDGSAVHHLIDPRTGSPARTGLLAVTVAAPDPAWAEVWTKALFLAGRGAIADESRARGLAAWWVDDRWRLGMTPAARVRSAWVDEARLG